MTRASPARIQRRIEQDHRMVHQVVKKTAQELAGAFYEWQATHTARANEFYAAYPSLDAFVRRDWPNFVRAAKECLADQLKDPAVSEIEKRDIYEALINDAQLPYSQQEVQITGFRH
jgi:hypothetical protein